MKKQVIARDLELLIDHAMLSGATDVIVFDTSEVVVEDQLARRCLKPRCGNYGLSLSCPPYVKGPSFMREDLALYSKAVFFRIEVPHYSLYSDGYREIFQLLHEVVSCIEKKAFSLGYNYSKGFAGNSCKEVFCYNYAECAALEDRDACRNPGKSKPSMSGFGINVSDLMKKAGWSSDTKKADGSDSGTTNVSGLVLIG